MKLSLLLGLSGAAVLPVLYECYINLSQGIALFLIACWSVFCGVKFSPLSSKGAATGISACLAYSGIMGMIGFVVIHPAAVKFLEKHSTYFYPDGYDGFKKQTYFILSAAFIMAMMYAVCFGIKGIGRAIKHIRGNIERSADYIDGAFSDDEESKTQ